MSISSIPLSSACSPQVLPQNSLVFFSGGTALRSTAQALGRLLPRQTIHLVTTFDSGGSSAALRHAFGMPAVGDIRNRLLALADHRVAGVSELHTLLSFRLPHNASTRALVTELSTLVRGRHPLMRQLSLEQSAYIQEQLRWFVPQLPHDFPLAGTSIGNLLLTAGYLRHQRQLLPAIVVYERMLHSLGFVRPMSDIPMDLGVSLASGQDIIGQHRFTGKDTPCITSPITDLWLVPASQAQEESIAVEASPEILQALRTARMICFPMGSFYSSILANLLARGVGQAVLASPGKKVFIPNTGYDPELFGHSLALQIERLTHMLHRDGGKSPASACLDLVLMDTAVGKGLGQDVRAYLEEQGMALHMEPLVSSACAPHLDGHLLAQSLQRLF